MNLFGTEPYPEELKDSCEMVCGVGCMIEKHMPDTIFEMLMAIIKKGGYYVFSIRDSSWADEKLGYGPAMAKMVAEGKYVEKHRRPYKRGTENPDLMKGRPDLMGI